MTIYRINGTVITDQYESVEAAVKAGINLSYANLTDANLTNAYITIGNRMFQLTEVK